MINDQLELGLESIPPCSGRAPRQRQAKRANWWFQRMRGVVEDTPEWRTSPPATTSREAPPPPQSPSTGLGKN